MMNNKNQKLQQYEHLISISRDLASTLDLESLLQKIVNTAAELCDSEEASILLYDENNQKLFFQTATNKEKQPGLMGIVVPTNSIAGWVALNRQPVIVNNVHQDKRFFNKVEKDLEFPTHSILAIPLIAKEKLIGVLEVLNKKSGIYNLEDQEILMNLGAQAAIAIENTRLFQQSDLISELVHEIRTPLTSINTISYLLQQSVVLDEERAKLARIIQEETQRLSRMTTQFLDLSRLESGRIGFSRTRFSLPELLQECAQNIQAEVTKYGLQLTLDIPDKTVEIDADRDKIKQVILNLLSNAVKYNRKNGKIIIHAHSHPDWIEISVQDNGMGIPEEEIPEMFNKFFRSEYAEGKKPGTGLGLSICKRIVESHGGNISVKSRLDKGSTFTFQLPR